MESENFIHLHTIGNATLGNKNTLRLVVLVNDDATNDHLGELSRKFALSKIQLV